ncbi:TPA: tRNA (guanine(9)-N(1))-methyltransferase [Trebouxia sp. C0004]
MKVAEKAAKQADTARRRTEVQEKFAAMTEQEQEAWRLARQAKKQSRRSETEQKRARLQQGRIVEQAGRQLSGLENWHISREQQPYIDVFQDRKTDLVYLTADSPNELSELDSSKLYIVGGIVDRNRHKNICFRKAESQAIQTAKLPIEAYIKLASSQVLTVNHVVEILLSWLECKDWKEAFFKVIPTRKRAIESAADKVPEADVQEDVSGGQVQAQAEQTIEQTITAAMDAHAQTCEHSEAPAEKRVRTE